MVDQLDTPGETSVCPSIGIAKDGLGRDCTSRGTKGTSLEANLWTYRAAGSSTEVGGTSETRADSRRSAWHLVLAS